MFFLQHIRMSNQRINTMQYQQNKLYLKEGINMIEKNVL